MIFLIELVGARLTDGALRTFRFTDAPSGYTTKPTDDPPNVHYAPRVRQPGAYERTLFGSGGRTSGVADVDEGIIELVSIDGGADELDDYAFDGRALRIFSLSDRKAAYSSRVQEFGGTIEQTEVNADEVRLQLRSRLVVLETPIQKVMFKGTTLNSTLDEAEGEESLKDTPQPLLYGSPALIAPILVNRFYGIFKAGQRFDNLLEVRNRGTLLTVNGSNAATGATDYPTLTALRTATLAAGAVATCKTFGYIRIGGNITDMIVTAKVQEGSNAAARRAGAIVGRILIQQAGMVAGTDFSTDDLLTIDTDAPYEVEYWTGTNNPNILDVVSEILNSVGASIVPDALGMIRFKQFRGVFGTSQKRFTEVEIMDNNESSILRIPTGDENNGIPASKVTVFHTKNYAVTGKENLTGTTTLYDPTFTDFVQKEWRQIDKTNTAISNIYKLAKPIEFETHLTTTANAEAEANRRNFLYGVKRDRFSVPIKPRYAKGLELGQVVTLQVNRFKLQDGKDFVIIGIRQDHQEQLTILELWG